KLPEFTSSLELEAGADLFSIGNPYNLGPAATLGYVSAVDREVKIGEHDWRHVLQVSMPVNEGDQGGPVADAEGRVVAMLLTTMREDPARGIHGAPQGVSFAVPMERALPTARAIRKLWEASLEAADGEAVAADRPWLGVRGYDIEDPTLRRHLRLEDGVGVLIERVFRNSPAETGGLMSDDVIVGFGGEPVRGSEDLSRRIMSAKPRSMITLDIIRAGEAKSITLTVGSY
ncbi:MAG: PDZ domain-containing protein, partial [Planctomycetes bacterium]|nr:PDZ domain-containing protein [Planctomycetota bacterium]